MKYRTTFEPSVLKAIALFISLDETRIILTGILVEPTATGANLIATDGRRLVVHSVDWRTAANATSFIIPASIIELMPSDAQHVPWNLFFDGTRILISTPDFELGFAPLLGNYPDYRSVIPSPLPTLWPADLILNRAFVAEHLELLDCLENRTNQGIEWLRDNAHNGPLIAKTAKTLAMLIPMKKEGE